MRAADILGRQVGPQGLRHSYGVGAVTAAAPLPTVAAVFGHASLTATVIGAEVRELVIRVWTWDWSRCRGEAAGMTPSTFDAPAGERIVALVALIAGGRVVVRLR